MEYQFFIQYFFGVRCIDVYAVNVINEGNKLMLPLMPINFFHLVENFFFIGLLVYDVNKRYMKCIMAVFKFKLVKW